MLLRPNLTSIDLIFSCTNNVNIKTCTYTIGPHIKELYGINITTCYYNTIEVCDGMLLNTSHYPIPILTNTVPSSFPVVGGSITLTGFFLKFVQSPNYFELSSGSKAMILSDTTVNTFDPTNININIPQGCGTDSLKLSQSDQPPISINYLPPIIINSTFVDDGSYLRLNGINFCNTSSIYLSFNGFRVDNQFITIENSTSIKFQLNYNFSSKNVTTYIKFGNNGPQTNNYSRSLPPYLTKVNSTPAYGGMVTIKGKRLKSETPNAVPIVRINYANCEITTFTTEQIICELQPGYDGKYDLIVTIDGIQNENTLEFTYQLPSFFDNGFRLNGTTAFFEGECLGTNTTTKVFINDEILTGFIVNDKQSLLSFNLDGSVFDNATIIVTVNNINATSTFLPPLYVTPVFPISNHGGNLTFKFYYNDRTIHPTVIINPDNGNYTLDATPTSVVDQTDGSMLYTVQNFPPLCGGSPIKYKSDKKEFFTKISSDKPSFAGKCEISGNVTSCKGLNFGGSSFRSQSKILYGGNEVELIEFTDIDFSFVTPDWYTTGDITVESCGNQTNLTFNYGPIYSSNIATGFDVKGGDLFVYGKHFSPSTSPKIDCNVTMPFKYECTNMNATCIKCSVLIPGPHDLKCLLSFPTSDIPTKNDVYISYHEPLPLSTNTIYPQGGVLTIYGRYFYDAIENVKVGDMQCTEPILVDSNFIFCNLPASSSPQITNPSENNLMMTTTATMMSINLTIAGKSGSNLIFSYGYYFNFTTILNTVDPMIIATAIIILLGFGSVYAQLAFVLYNNKQNSEKPIIKEDTRKLRRQLTQPKFQIPQRTTSFINSRY